MTSKNNQPKHYKQLKVISDSAFIEEASHTKLIMQGIVIIASVIVLMVIWSAFTKIDEIAVGHGEIIPIGREQAIQQLEGGIIDKIFVKNGSTVKKGQTLIKMNAVRARTELARARSVEIGLIIDKQRLNAFIHNKPANLSQWASAVINSKYNPVNNSQQITELLAAEQQQLTAQYQAKQNQQNSLKANIKYHQEALEKAKNELTTWQKHIALLKKELTMYDKLKGKGIISQREHLAKLREMNQAKGDKQKIQSEIQQAKQAIQESQSKLLTLNSNLKKQALTELGKTNDELLLIQHQIERLQAELSRIIVTAPIEGIIKGLTLHAGSVVQPGAKLLDIVPINQELVAEVNINQRDIGHVKVGDPVNLKVLTYDYAHYGSIKGRLIDISPSSYADDKSNKTFYRGIVKLNQQYLGNKNNAKSLVAGMVVEANIITGKKSLMAYMLKPFRHAANSSFNER